jgi:hypothetical protein
MSKCKMKITGATPRFIIFECQTDHIVHTYHWKPTLKGRLKMGRGMWRTRIEWGKRGVHA